MSEVDEAWAAITEGPLALRAETLRKRLASAADPTDGRISSKRRPGDAERASADDQRFSSAAAVAVASACARRGSGRMPSGASWVVPSTLPRRTFTSIGGVSS